MPHPEEWAVRVERFRSHDWLGGYVVGDDGVICFLPEPDGDDDPAWYARARLIVDAPELLRVALDVLGSFHGSYTGPGRLALAELRALAEKHTANPSPLQEAV